MVTTLFLVKDIREFGKNLAKLLFFLSHIASFSIIVLTLIRDIELILNSLFLFYIYLNSVLLYYTSTFKICFWFSSDTNSVMFAVNDILYHIYVYMQSNPDIANLQRTENYVHYIRVYFICVLKVWNLAYAEYIG